MQRGGLSVENTNGSLLEASLNMREGRTADDYSYPHPPSLGDRLKAPLHTSDMAAMRECGCRRGVPESTIFVSDRTWLRHNPACAGCGQAFKRLRMHRRLRNGGRRRGGRRGGAQRRLSWQRPRGYCVSGCQRHFRGASWWLHYGERKLTTHASDPLVRGRSLQRSYPTLPCAWTILWRKSIYRSAP